MVREMFLLLLCMLGSNLSFPVDDSDSNEALAHIYRMYATFQHQANSAWQQQRPASSGKTQPAGQAQPPMPAGPYGAFLNFPVPYGMVPIPNAYNSDEEAGFYGNPYGVPRPPSSDEGEEAEKAEAEEEGPEPTETEATNLSSTAPTTSMLTDHVVAAGVPEDGLQHPHEDNTPPEASFAYAV